MITSDSWKTREKGKGVYFSENKFSKFSTRLSKNWFIHIKNTFKQSFFNHMLERYLKRK